MDIIIKKEECKDCPMRCKSSPDCCCSCPKACIGRTVCPIFNYFPEVKKRKERMTRDKYYKNMFDELINN